jgi:PilZ domain
MSEQRPKRETLSIEKATISNMWEIDGRNSVYGNDAEEKIAAHVTKGSEKEVFMDLRRHQRFPVHFHSVFSGPTLSESVGTVVNLSESGCCVHTDSQVYTGIQLALHLHVPGEASPIHIEQAAVRWGRERELGVGFITVAPPHQARLDQLLARLKPEQQP